MLDQRRTQPGEDALNSSVFGKELLEWWRHVLWNIFTPGGACNRSTGWFAGSVHLKKGGNGIHCEPGFNELIFPGVPIQLNDIGAGEGLDHALIGQAAAERLARTAPVSIELHVRLAS